MYKYDDLYLFAVGHQAGWLLKQRGDMTLSGRMELQAALVTLQLASLERGEWNDWENFLPNLPFLEWIPGDGAEA